MDWMELSGRTLKAGAITAAVTTLTVAACGQAELGNPIAPLNAISHIAWGEQSARQNDISATYTLTGVALNALAVTSWALLYEAAFGAKTKHQNMALTLAGGVAIAGLAYIVDYHVVPERLTPGFEKRLSDSSLLTIYAALAASLPIRAAFGREQPESSTSVTTSPHYALVAKQS